MNKRTLLGTFLASSAISIGFAAQNHAKTIETPRPMTMIPSRTSSPVKQLKDILAYVYEHSDEIASARIDVRIADESVNHAKAVLRPTLSSSGGKSINRVKDSRKGPNAGTNVIDHTPHASVNLNHRLFDFGASEGGIRKADEEVRASRCDLANAVQNVFLEVLKAIITIKQAEETIRIKQENAKDVLVILEQTRTKHLVGIENQAAVELAVANYEQAKAGVTQAEGQLEQAKADYLYATKMQAPKGLTMPPVVENLPKSLEELQTIALKDNPAILSAQYKLKAALEAIDASKRDVKPSINLSGQAKRELHGRNVEGIYGRNRYGSNSASVSLDLNVPLYTPQAYSQIRQAQEQSLKMRKQLKLAQLKIQQNCTSLWANFLTLQAELHQIQASIVAQRESVRGALEGKVVGTTSVYEIIQTQQQLYSYMDQLNQKQAAYYQVQYQFLMLMGRLTAEYLNVPVKLYKPEDNYEEFAESWLAFKDKEKLEIQNDDLSFDVEAALPPVPLKTAEPTVVPAQAKPLSKEKTEALLIAPSKDQ